MRATGVDQNQVVGLEPLRALVCVDLHLTGQYEDPLHTLVKMRITVHDRIQENTYSF